MNCSFSFWSCCIFCWTISSSLSTASSSSSFSWAFCSASYSRVCAVFSALAFWRASSFALRSWSVMCEGSGMRDSVVFVMVVLLLVGLGGNILLGPLLWWLRELFSDETRLTLMLGGPKNRRESPDTRTTRFNVQFAKDRETKNLQKTTLASKVVNLFTRAHTPPFIRRRRAFLHFENTLECKEYS
jgi:hypothetical protein